MCLSDDELILTFPRYSWSSSVACYYWLCWMRTDHPTTLSYLCASWHCSWEGHFEKMFNWCKNLAAKCTFTSWCHCILSPFPSPKIYLLSSYGRQLITYMLMVSLYLVREQKVDYTAGHLYISLASFEIKNRLWILLFFIN